MSPPTGAGPIVAGRLTPTQPRLLGDGGLYAPQSANRDITDLNRIKVIISKHKLGKVCLKIQAC